MKLNFREGKRRSPFEEIAINGAAAERFGPDCADGVSAVNGADGQIGRGQGAPVDEGEDANRFCLTGVEIAGELTVAVGFVGGDGDCEGADRYGEREAVSTEFDKNSIEAILRAVIRGGE